MPQLSLRSVNIDTIVGITLNTLFLWSSVYVLINILPTVWARCLLLLSIALTVGIKGNKLYKRRGKWNKLGSNDLALITGGSNGLGLNLIEELLKKGVKVINIDIEPVPKHISQRCVSIKCDLSNESAVLEALNVIKKDIGTPTIIINNAAIRQNERFENLSTSQIHKIIQVNIVSPMLIIKTLITKNSERLYVINISSILGFVSPANLSIYSMTKASLVSLHDTLSSEYLSNPNIRFLLAIPGQLNTRMFKDVVPPKQFFAPVLNSLQLAKQITNKIEMGERGSLYGPFYTNFLPLLRMLPLSLVEFARWFSEMDVSVKEKVNQA